MFKLVLEKAEEPEIKLPTSAGSWKKQETSRKTPISALLTMPKPLTVWIATNCGKFKQMGIPDHLTCLLRNLYAGQEATVRTGHGTTDWFQIGKGVRQGCILSPCLFDLYTVYTRWMKHKLDSRLPGKISITSDMQIIPLLWQKAKIIVSTLITSWQIDGKSMETVTDFIFLGSKVTVDGGCSHENKRHLLPGRKAMTKNAQTTTQLHSSHTLLK